MPKVPLATSICLIKLFVNLLPPLLTRNNTNDRCKLYIYIHVYSYVDMYTTVHDGTEEILPYHKLVLKCAIVGVIFPIYNNTSTLGNNNIYSGRVKEGTENLLNLITNSVANPTCGASWNECRPPRRLNK